MTRLSNPVASVDVPRLVEEFLPLNRRRLHGGPPLSVAELERWLEVRTLLERALGAAPPWQREAKAIRRALRVPVHLRVRFQHGGGEGLAASRDLSEGGVFIATNRPLHPGTPLRLEIEGQPGLAPVQATGVVSWTRSGGSEGPTGMGVRFENLDPGQQLQIAALVENALARL